MSADYLLYLFYHYGILVLAGLGLRVLLNSSGLVSLGHGALAGLAALLNYQLNNYGLPFPLAAILSIVLTLSLGLLLFEAGRNLRGPNYAAYTLAAHVLFLESQKRLPAWGGGFSGFSTEPNLELLPAAILVLLCLLVGLLGVIRFESSPLSASARAFKSDPVMAHHLSLSELKSRLSVGTLSIGLTATAGCLALLQLEHYQYSSFGLEYSFELLIVALFPSPKSPLAPVLGGFCLALLQKLSGDYLPQNLLLGACLLLIIFINYLGKQRWKSSALA